MANNYIPSRDADFDGWFKFMNQYVTQKCAGSPPAWDHIPQAALTELSDAYTAWYAAYSVTLGPCTSQEKAEKRRARGAAEKVIRPFVSRYLRYPPVTDEDRDNMRVPNHDAHPTPVPAPESIPLIEVETPHPRTVRIRFKAEHAARWGKPEHVHGLECLWLIAEAPPEKVKDLIHSEFATKSPLELVFEEDERGKKVYFAACWETDAAKKGKWSDIFFAVIP